MTAAMSRSTMTAQGARSPPVTPRAGDRRTTSRVRHAVASRQAVRNHDDREGAEPRTQIRQRHIPCPRPRARRQQEMRPALTREVQQMKQTPARPRTPRSRSSTTAGSVARGTPRKSASVASGARWMRGPGPQPPDLGQMRLARSPRVRRASGRGPASRATGQPSPPPPADDCRDDEVLDAVGRSMRQVEGQLFRHVGWRQGVGRRSHAPSRVCVGWPQVPQTSVHRRRSTQNLGSSALIEGALLVGSDGEIAR